MYNQEMVFRMTHYPLMIAAATTKLLGKGSTALTVTLWGGLYFSVKGHPELRLPESVIEQPLW